MQNILCFAAVFLLSHTALAAEPHAWLGAPGCRIALLDSAPRHGAVRWTGACDDGFAAGHGELEWRNDKGKRHRLKATLVRGEVQGEGELKTSEFTYIGTFLRGVPHGSGFFTYKSGTMYEGGVVNGKHEGKGIFVGTDRSEYTGEWKNDKEHGWGQITYGRGGSYSGQWQDGNRHGLGRIVYAGSGRTFEGRFENDLIAGTSPPVKQEMTDSVYYNGAPTIINYLPLDASWDQLTDAQKNVVRGIYPALEAGDDPPYPVHGSRGLMTTVAELNSAAGKAHGYLRVYALIGADGKARQVKVYEKPVLDEMRNVDRLVTYIAQRMMQETYKPAMCQGTPCEMIYSLFFSFSREPANVDD